MPFADDRCLVAAFLQQFRKGLLVAVENMLVLHEAVQVGVLTRLDNCSTGSTEGIGDETIVEAYAFVGYAVEIRGGSDVLEASSIGGHGLVGMVVGKNEYDVQSHL